MWGRSDGKMTTTVARREEIAVVGGEVARRLAEGTMVFKVSETLPLLEGWRRHCVEAQAVVMPSDGVAHTLPILLECAKLNSIECW